MFVMAGLLAGAGLVACASQDSTCAEAAAQLTSCTTDQRQAFEAACEQNDGADPATLGADATAACAAVPSDGKADAGTDVLTGVCVAGMYGVKWGITALSPAGGALSDPMNAELRTIYGSLVDGVTVTIGAELPPKIVIAGHELGVQPDAMTFGNHVFVLQAVADDTTTPNRLLLTITHELTHVKQGQNDGGFYGFAVSYCRDMIAVNFDYDLIAEEIAAYAVEGTARQNLARCGHVVCM